MFFTCFSVKTLPEEFFFSILAAFTIFCEGIQGASLNTLLISAFPCLYTLGVLKFKLPAIYTKVIYYCPTIEIFLFDHYWSNCDIFSIQRLWDTNEYKFKYDYPLGSSWASFCLTILISYLHFYWDLYPVAGYTLLWNLEKQKVLLDKGHQVGRLKGSASLPWHLI